MKVNFSYNEDKDIDCLLSKGGGSQNQPGSKTKTYEALLAYTSDLGNREIVSEFVRKFIRDNKLDPQRDVLTIQKNWDSIGERFEKCAERVFGVSIMDTISAYLTITGRFPYRLDERYFYVSARKTNVNAVAMHELWHFYTWHKFGREVERKIGMEKYNDIKEALTVLLNIECSELMCGEIDKGYPQHQELRNKITDIWNKNKDVDEVWNDVLS
ncbi:MAG: hypothetical protein WC666_02680 [Candidatus Paceibacterota bacterium]|jgi:hypothetical protein